MLHMCYHKGDKMLGLKRITKDSINSILEFWYENGNEIRRDLLDKAVLDRDKYITFVCLDLTKVYGTIIVRLYEQHGEILDLSYDTKRKQEILERLFFVLNNDITDGLVFFVKDSDFFLQYDLRDIGGFKYIDSVDVNGETMFKFEKELTKRKLM